MENDLGEVKVVENNIDHYVLEKEDGTQIKAFKIKRDEMQKIHDDLNRKVAENLKVDTLIELISRLEEIMNNLPTFDKWRETADELTDFLEYCYNEVGNPNQFHHPIKNVNPEIYGRADTFLKEVLHLHTSMLEVAEMMKEMEKIKEIHTSNRPHRKFTILVRTYVPLAHDFEYELEDLVMKYTELRQIEDFVSKDEYKVFTKIT